MEHIIQRKADLEAAYKLMRIYIFFCVFALCVLFLFIIMLALSKPCGAQETLPDKPQPQITINMKCLDFTCADVYQMRIGKSFPVTMPVIHKTVDKKFIALSTINLLFTVGDAENTIQALKNPLVHENNPVLGTHPGRARFYGIMIPLYVVDELIARKLKREDDALRDNGYPGHKYFPWWIAPVANIMAHGAGIGTTLATTGR